MTGYDIIKTGLSHVYGHPEADAEALMYSASILQTLIADCFSAENNSRADDNQLEEIPVINVTESANGDVNLDGRTTAADAALIMRYLGGLDTLNDLQKRNADVNGDGQITTADAEMILQNIIGLDNWDVPYNDHLTRIALPYGIAWKYCAANDRVQEAELYRNLYEEARMVGGRGKWI